MEKRKGEIDTALNDWANTYTPPTTRSTGGTKAASGAVVDDLGADMFDAE